MKKNRPDANEVKKQLQGSWSGLLSKLGIDGSYLQIGKHTPCPACGGADRYCFDDKTADKTYICRVCGAGDGISLVQKVFNISFYQALVMITDVMDGEGVSSPTLIAGDSSKTGSNASDNTNYESRLNAFKKLIKYTSRTPTKQAEKYYKGRGLDMVGRSFDAIQYGNIAYSVYQTLRVNNKVFRTPAVVALYSHFQGEYVGAIQIYLDRESIAPLLGANQEYKPKPMFRKTSPNGLSGCGIWFTNSKTRVLHVVEGLENALSVAGALNTRSVVASGTCSLLGSLVIPEHVQELHIWSDSDEKGLHHSSKLMERVKNRMKVFVYSTDSVKDWNDIYRMDGGDFIKKKWGGVDGV